jgi:AmiR/NasT family two-component response regulator
VLHWIRQQAWLQGLPVVVFTARHEDDSVGAAMGSGADTYVIKGNETEGLIHLLKNAALTWPGGNLSPRPVSFRNPFQA